MRAAGCQERAPESQTLTALSFEPETIVLPSGENATDVTRLLCALLFSLFSSSVAAQGGKGRQFWSRKSDLGPKRT